MTLGCQVTLLRVYSTFVRQLSVQRQRYGAAFMQNLISCIMCTFEADFKRSRRIERNGVEWIMLKTLTNTVVAILALFCLMGCAGSKRQAEPIPPVCNTEQLLATARSQVGIPYRFGGLTPESGFDCSGFTCWVYSRHGIELPRRSIEQVLAGVPVSREQLKPGDLVFFEIHRKGASHVGIYTGNDVFVHCPSSGGRVREDRLTDTYWRKRYRGACRVHR